MRWGWKVPDGCLGLTAADCGSNSGHITSICGDAKRSIRFRLSRGRQMGVCTDSVVESRGDLPYI